MHSHSPQTLDEPAEQALVRRRINALREAIGKVCAEVGCVCIAERISPPQGKCETLHRMAVGQLTVQESTALDLLPKLTRLSQALSTAGYYDMALECAKVACYYEPVLDLDLSRAYLHLVLGETDEARAIYFGIIKRYKTLPAAALDRLTSLAETHGDEEDILELRNELAPYAE